MKRNEKGQALVEMAIILPILIILITGIIEFGFVFNTYLTLNNASREAARSISVGETTAQATARALEVAPILQAADLSIAYFPTGDNRNRGDSVTVTLTYNYRLFTPIISGIIGSNLSLESQTTMRVE